METNLEQTRGTEGIGSVKKLSAPTSPFAKVDGRYVEAIF